MCICLTVSLAFICFLPFALFFTNIKGEISLGLELGHLRQRKSTEALQSLPTDASSYMMPLEMAEIERYAAVR